ncbi:MAG TPA: hypothetical protein VE995_02255, partial [Gaiellaceae bacterium]|nr:hypothetical protein [Gaiellaceae bacterium]
MNLRKRLTVVCAAAALVLGAVAVVAGGCGGQEGSTFTPTQPDSSLAASGTSNGSGGSGSADGGSSSGGFGTLLGGDGGGGPPACALGDGGLASCVNLNCPANSMTTLSGKVYDPAGSNPLYNVVVYVPRDPHGQLTPITLGTHSCNTCDVTIGDYVAAGVTDESGSFRIGPVPTGQNIPLVFQIGKWRREIAVTTKDCSDTVVPAGQARLPRNQSEGDIPQMAILYGGCDQLPCFMRNMGLDAKEFTGPNAGGRLHVYQGDSTNGGSTPGPNLGGGGGGTAGNCTSNNAGNCPLWSQKSQLERYDMVLLSCECDTHDDTKPNKQPLHDWLDEGGKVFATHYHYTWFENGPADFQKVANWSDAGLTLNVPGPFQVDQSFPKGQAFYKWLGNVGALNANGTINLTPSDVRTSVATVNPPTLRWIYDTTNENVKYLSFGTPIGGIDAGAGGAGGTGSGDAAATEAGSSEAGSNEAGAGSSAGDAGEQTAPVYCGKAVLTDLHAGGGSNVAGSSAPLPSSCKVGAMTPQEKALEFLFFDLSACVSNDN